MIVRRFLAYSLLAVIVVAGTWYLARRPELLVAFETLSVTDVASVLVAKLSVAWVNGLKFRELSLIFGLSLRHSEWLGLSAVTTFYSYVMPARTNVAPRAWYLRKHHDFPYLLQVPLVVGANLIDLFISFLVLASCTAYLVLEIGTLRNLFVGIGGSIFLLTVAIAFLFAVPIRQSGGLVSQHLGRIKRGFATYAERPTQTASYALACAASVLSRAIALWVCFFVLGQDVSLALALVAVGVSAIALPTAIVPGNLGVTEAILVLVMVAGGVNATDAIAPVLLSRAGSIVVQFSLGIVFSYLLFGRDNPA